MPQPAHDWFAEPALLLPRFLGLLDREPRSGTYGCADRNYWHYSLLDLPNARYQELAWLLALAYQATPNQLVASPSVQRLAGHPKLLAWIQATVDFWLQHRHPDGSVDEVYPYERSFCATAFSTATLAETRHLLGPKLALPPHALINTGRWLANHQNPAVSNQQAASLLALYHLAHLTDDAPIKAGLAQRRQALLTDQRPDGTWVEYGGLDVGYLTITLAMLAVYVQHSHDADLHQACVTACQRVASKIDADGTYDWQGNSRNTRYLYPSGLAYFAPDLLPTLTEGMPQGKLLTPLALDDRYSIAFATDFWLTGLQAQAPRPAPNKQREGTPCA